METVCCNLCGSDETVKVISSTIEIVELMEKGVTTLEKLTLVRKAFPSIHALYFITPTENSVQRLINDFKDPEKPQYAAAHVFFSNQLSEDLFHQIGKSSGLLSRCLTFTEFNLDFYCIENGLFHCN